MSPLLFQIDAAPGLCAGLARRLGAETGLVELRHFPDGESYVRFGTPVAQRDVILLCTLDRPDPKLAPLLFAACAARRQGASSVGLAAPYLAYMRQDTAFRAGEAVTSEIFAKLVSGAVDWLVTLDPHLHRYPALDSIYETPALAATATEAIGRWIADNVERPLIVGPDQESRAWAERIARHSGGKAVILSKRRSGDRSVRIDDRGLEPIEGATPVLVDDIASTAQTLIEAIRLITGKGGHAPVCAVVHAIFAEDSYQSLLALGVERVVSTNTVAHVSNAIDIAAPLADAISRSVSEARTAKSGHCGEAQ
jgi:ribose-phosphate pyrophosphokinase